MNNLIKINYETEQPTVSARDLHEALEVGTAFKDWFPRMAEYGFKENEDFNMLKNERVQCEGNREVRREITDYSITVDMAKEICMLQRTEKGKECRTYFIELEKAWNTPEQIMSRALKMADQKINQLKTSNITLLTIIEQDKPKVIFADAVTASDKSILIGELAKIIKQNGVDTGEKRLFTWLRENGYLIKRKGTDYNAPTQKSMDLGLFMVKETAISHSDGHVTVNKTTKVTGKGQQYFINKFLDKEMAS